MTSTDIVERLTTRADYETAEIDEGKRDPIFADAKARIKSDAQAILVLLREKDEWFREAEDRANSCSILLRERDEAREVLLPLATLELPKHRPEGSTGFYSIRFAAIEAAKRLLHPVDK